MTFVIVHELCRIAILATKNWLKEDPARPSQSIRRLLLFDHDEEMDPLMHNLQFTEAH